MHTFNKNLFAFAFIATAVSTSIYASQPRFQSVKGKAAPGCSVQCILPLAHDGSELELWYRHTLSSQALGDIAFDIFDRTALKNSDHDKKRTMLLQAMRGAMKHNGFLDFVKESKISGMNVIIEDDNNSPERYLVKMQTK